MEKSKKKEIKKETNKKVIIYFRDGKFIESEISNEDDIMNDIRLIADKAGYKFPRDVIDYKIS